MKNILVITLGTRDVQLDEKLCVDGLTIETHEKDKHFLVKEGLPKVELRQVNKKHYPTMFVPTQPRHGGELLNKYYDDFKKAICFPLILPLLAHLDKAEKTFQEVWWVFTDQENEPSFMETDTLFFKSILEKYFHSRYGNAIDHVDYRITHQVRNIDQQYRDFYLKGKQLVDGRDDIGEIFLFPQGGIDQINHALTLQFIQLFKEKVRLYQVAEKAEAVDELTFTQLFLQDLTKQTLLKHLRDYDFDKAEDMILANAWQKKLCRYANLRLNMKQEDAFKLYNNKDKNDRPFIDDSFLSLIRLDWKNTSTIQKNKLKLSDAIIATKILFTQKKFNDALMRLFTVFENLFKIQLELELNLEKDIIEEFYNPHLQSNDKNEKWELFISSIDPSLLPYLLTCNVRLNNPSRKAYWYIYKYLRENSNQLNNTLALTDLENLCDVMEKITNRRNGIAHNLKGIAEKDFQKIFTDFSYSQELLFTTLDTLTGTHGFGIYQLIQEKIMAYYD